MSTVTVSPLRQRMIEDMNARKLCAGTQRGHIHSCKRFAAFLKRSPDTATSEDVRRFQLHLSETGASICSGRRTPHAATTVPLLRRTHVHHRDLRARQRAKASTHTGDGRDQDRHLMMPSSLIRTEARHSGRLSPGSTPACADQQDWPVIAPQILSNKVQSARSRQQAPPSLKLKRSDRQRRLNFRSTRADAKSP